MAGPSPDFSTFLMFQGGLYVVDGPLELIPTEDGGRLVLPSFPQEETEGPAEILIERSGSIDTGSLLFDGHRCELLGEVQAGALPLQGADGELLQLLGVQGTWIFPAGGRIVREDTVFVATSDAELGERILAAFARDPEPQADAALPWTLDGATRYVGKRLVDGGFVSEMEISGPGSLAIVSSAGSRSKVNLHNVWRNVDGEPPARGKELLDGFVQSLVEPREGTTRDSLLPRLYAGTEMRVEHRNDQGEVTKIELASRRIGDDLIMVYVHDLPTTMRPITAQEAVDIEADDDVRAAVARDNLLATVPRIRIAGGPIYMAMCGGNYEASLLLLPEFWAFMKPLLDGPPLVAVPTRDLLFVTGDTGEERRDELWALIARLESPAYEISRGIYKMRGDGWLQRIEPIASD